MRGLPKYKVSVVEVDDDARCTCEKKISGGYAIKIGDTLYDPVCWYGAAGGHAFLRAVLPMLTDRQLSRIGLVVDYEEERLEVGDRVRWKTDGGVYTVTVAEHIFSYADGRDAPLVRFHRSVAYPKWGVQVKDVELVKRAADV